MVLLALLACAFGQGVVPAEKVTHDVPTIDANVSDFSMFGLANVRDYALEGEWNFTDLDGSSAYIPFGDGIHHVVVTGISGDVYVREVMSTGMIIDDHSSLVVQRHVQLVPDADLVQGGYCPNGTLTAYPPSSIVSVSTSGNCWTMALTPAGCSSYKCNAFQGSSCTLEVNTPFGQDVYTDDCGGGLKFVWCVGGTLAVCH